MCCRWLSPPHTLAARSDPKVVLSTKRYNVFTWVDKATTVQVKVNLSLHLHLVTLVLNQAPVAAATSLLSTRCGI